jgi:integrase
MFRELRESAGLPKAVQFRDLRRTAAAEVLESGRCAEPHTGHEQRSSVLRVYQVLNKKSARASQKAQKAGQLESKSWKIAEKLVGNHFI